jgi:mannose-6-phosphate isomerase-like protein (cupin superfamily)
MRKVIMGILLLLMASSAKAQSPMVATDITAAQVQAFIKEAPHDRNSDRPMRVIDAGGYRIGIFGVFRPKGTPPNATVHQTNVAEVYYVLEGAGMLVTGGTLKKTATPRPSTLGNWTDVASDGIDGGVSRRIAKGDVVIIPGGVPHGWASTEGDVTYLIVRPDPDKKLALK